MVLLVIVLAGGSWFYLPLDMASSPLVSTQYTNAYANTSTCELQTPAVIDTLSTSSPLLLELNESVHAVHAAATDTEQLALSVDPAVQRSSVESGTITLQVVLKPNAFVGTGKLLGDAITRCVTNVRSFLPFLVNHARRLWSQVLPAPKVSSGTVVVEM